MKIKVTTPYDIVGENNHLLAKFISLFEEELKTVKEIHGEYQVKIHREVGDIFCGKIAQIYKEAGWKVVTCVCIKSQGRYNEIEYTTILTLKR